MIADPDHQQGVDDPLQRSYFDLHVTQGFLRYAEWHYKRKVLYAILK